MSTFTVLTPIGKRYPQRIGTQLQWNGTITGTASYATGGDTLTAKSLGMNAIEGGIFSCTSLLPQVITVAGLLTALVKIIVPSTLAEQANTSNLTAFVFTAILWGH